MQTLMITGVAGFLGRYIARYCFERGWNVLGIDYLPPENAPLHYLSSYYSLNLPDDRLDQLIRQHRPTVCVHCAGRASVDLSISDPVSDFYTGTALTFELLNALRLHGPECRFIFLSSAAVYGNPVSLPVGESHSLAPISPYGFHKWQGEILCREFYAIYGLPTASVRIFSAYGPGLRRQVVWDICRKVLSQPELLLHGTGQESRDFIHALDIARALEFVITGASFQGEAYNLASGREVTIRELVELILLILDAKFDPQFDGIVPQGAPRRWQADLTKINALGFAPAISLEDGLQTFAHWCRAELG